MSMIYNYFGFLIFISLLQILNCSEWKYICDQKHLQCIVAGDTADNNVYHQIPHGRANAKWIFISTGEWNSFYICDQKHYKCIVAGDNADNNIYHQNPNGRSNAKWYKSGANICDYKHHKCLVAGDNADNHVYHQYPNQRENAQWFIFDA